MPDRRPLYLMAASPALGGWLRAQRLARGWSVAHLARLPAGAAKAADDYTVASAAILASYVRRWESGRISPPERYQLLYCTVLEIPPESLGPDKPVPLRRGGAAQRERTSDIRPAEDMRPVGIVSDVVIVIPPGCRRVVIHMADTQADDEMTGEQPPGASLRIPRRSLG